MRHHYSINVHFFYFLNTFDALINSFFNITFRAEIPACPMATPYSGIEIFIILWASSDLSVSLSFAHFINVVFYF